MFKSTLLVASGLLVLTNSERAPIRINCGSFQDVDIDGITFEADRNSFGWFDGTGSTSADISTLYQTFRDGWWPGFSYTFDLDADGAGEYLINLYFAEVEKTGPNQRDFDIFINGVEVLSDFDIYNEAGGANIPLIKTFDVTVSTNNLQISIYFRRNLFSSVGNAIVSAIEITALSNTPPTSWITGTPIPYALGELSAMAVDDKGYYVFGGNPSEESGLGFYFETVTYYDVATKTWTDTTPKAQFFAQADHQTPQAYNGKIYSYGGGNYFNGNFMRSYDPVTQEWEQLAELVVDGLQWFCLSPSSAVIGDKIYIAGGIINDETVDRLFEYDITNNIWSEKSPMPNGRNHAAGIGYNGLFYIFGGRTGSNIPDFGFKDSFVYNPQTDSWSSVAPMLSGTGGGGQAVEINGRLIVIGGETCCQTVNKVHAYDPLTNSWEYLSDMITPRHGIAPVAIGNAIYVAGGGTEAGFSQSTTHEILLFL